MKFGSQLDVYAVPEWRDKYIRYNVLKRFIARRKTELGKDYLVNSAPGVNSDVAHISLLEPLRCNSRSECDVIRFQNSPVGKINQEFLTLLDAELAKVESHFSGQLALLRDRAMGVQEELLSLQEEERKEFDLQRSFEQISSNQHPPHETEETLLTWKDSSFDSVNKLRVQKETDNEHTDVESSGSVSFPSTEISGRSSERDPKYISPEEERFIPEGRIEIDDKQDKPPVSMLSRVVHRIYNAGKKDKKDLETNAKTRSAHKERLARAIIGIWDYIDKLEGFVQLNMIALYKILKKRDKSLKLQHLNSDLIEKKRKLSLLVVSQFLKDSLLQLYRDCNKTIIPCKGGLYFQETIPNDVTELSVFLQRQSNLSRSLSGNWVSFFLGICLVVFLNIALASIIPPTNPTFSLDGILVLLPIFRLSFMLTLIIWGTAVAITTFEFYGINYKFLLNINPKCQVNSSTIYVVASLFTSVWFIGFGLYITDVKFGFLFHSSTYWLYPLIVILLQVLICCLPSKTFRYSYRKNLLYCIGETIKNGLWPSGKVTLIHNLIGDVLTSLPKPCIDLEYTLVFYFGFYFLNSSLSFNGLPWGIDQWVLLSLTLFPYWIRFIQCFTRFCKEKDLRYTHAANMGKYMSTIVVILTSNIYWEQFGLSVYASRLVFVFAYLFASLYNLIWDVIMDWGLLPDPDNFVRPNHRVMYPQWIYYFISILNLVGRLTWALTLIPIGIINNEKFNSSIIIFAISAIEVIRRSSWVILRLENEHLTNSSRYRAMLWVPKMTSTNDHHSLFHDEPFNPLQSQQISIINSNRIGEYRTTVNINSHTRSESNGCLI